MSLASIKTTPLVVTLSAAVLAVYLGFLAT